jgi:hypothetical protein
MLVNTAIALLGSPLLFASVSLLSVNLLAANAVCLTLLCLVRFMVADGWIWAAARESASNEPEPSLLAAPSLVTATSPEP